MTANAFNPRVLAGGRDITSEAAGIDFAFNPRVLAGGRDIVTSGDSRVSPLSIHASSREDATAMRLSNTLLYTFNPRVLAGGRDQGQYVCRFCQSVSIHASSREDATLYAIANLVIMCFNPRVLAGGRDPHTMHNGSIFKFQSTRPRGRTRHRWFHRLTGNSVSIHASSREDATKISY